MSDELIWDVRAWVYGRFAETGRAPSASAAGARFGLGEAEAAGVFADLHKRHALFLDQATGAIRMAHPFSAVETDYRVHANGHVYWANCAWDALGIPAALGAEAEVEAVYAESGQRAQVRVPVAGPDTGERIHFLLPFARWYEDLVYT
jgi:hypothetical protein